MRALLCIQTCLLALQLVGQDIVRMVNPFIGTDYTGNTYPGTQSPFGMVQLSPDNGLPGWDRIAGYFYPDSTIAGFSHTHLLGTGAGDMYDISFMPVTEPRSEAQAPLGVFSLFDHSSEVAHAGYYAVTLKDYNIRVELTATSHVGVQRYIYPLNLQEKSHIVLLNLGKAMNWDATTNMYLEQVDDYSVKGYRFSTGWARNQKVYFYTRFSAPIQSIQKSGGDSLTTFFFSSTQDTLEVYTALSPNGVEQAYANLCAETPVNGFDHYRYQTEMRWSQILDVITIEGGTKEQQRIFYTALYHSLLCPNLQSDADSTPYYETFSLWDTYRAQHPLLTLIVPQRVEDMVRSLIVFGERQGRLPVWNMWGSETDMMIGYHAAPVIADAYLKGLVSDSLAQRALNLCVRTADFYRVRNAQGEPMEYIPMGHRDIGGNDWTLSRTLEYAYDDACISKLAKKLGHKSIAREFERRSRNYRNLFNPVTGFFQPRDSVGNFSKDFRPGAFSPYICESNAWPYLFNVQHDLHGLCNLLGGPQKMQARLDALFTTPDDDNLPIFSTGKIGQYVHGNEPSHHIAYLYNYVGQPSQCQRLVSQIRREMYADAPDGLCGNEDCGQMSAWYVLSAMGLYPVDPCGGRYEIGSPMFPVLKLRLPMGKSFSVIANGVDETHFYIKGVKLNGRPLKTPYITHKQIMAGGVLEFIMSKDPCPAWYKTLKY